MIPALRKHAHRQGAVAEPALALCALLPETAREGIVLEDLGPHRAVSAHLLVALARHQQGLPEKPDTLALGPSQGEGVAAHDHDDIEDRGELLVGLLHPMIRAD